MLEGLVLAVAAELAVHLVIGPPLAYVVAPLVVCALC